VGNHPGRFKIVADNIHIKEVFASEGNDQHRYVIAKNPEQAKMERINREKISERLRCELGVLNRKKKTKAQCKLKMFVVMGLRIYDCQFCNFCGLQIPYMPQVDL
jgi:hypothetical protein